jgi:hypothetical protein
VAKENRQTIFNPTLFPDDQEALEFFLSLTHLELRILASGTRRGIQHIARVRGCPYSQVARYAIKASVALKKFQ